MPQIKQLPISSPLSLGDLLDRAFRLYRARFGTLLLTAAIFLVPLGILSGLFTGNFMVGYMDLLENMSVDPSAPPEAVLDELFFPLMGYFGGFMLFGIAWGIVSGLVSLALTSQTLSILHQKDQTLGQGIRIAWQRFWTYLLMNLSRFLAIAIASIAILIAIFIVGALILFLASALFGLSGNFLDSAGPAGDAGFLGMMILVCCFYFIAIVLMLFPALYLSARWIVATPGIVEQEWQAIESLRESWRLTSGNSWRCVGYLLLLYLLSMVIISLPQGIIQQLLVVFLPSELTEYAFIASTALGSLFTVLWQPFYMAAIVLLYYDLRVRKESYDLELRLQQLESEVELA